ncbi:MAG: hypothetical protein WDN24_19975 [Sphingomonas sp.]
MIAAERAHRIEIETLGRVDHHQIERRCVRCCLAQFVDLSDQFDIERGVARAQRLGDGFAQQSHEADDRDAHVSPSEPCSEVAEIPLNRVLACARIEPHFSNRSIYCQMAHDVNQPPE